MDESKTCAICRVAKPLADFAKNNRRPDGRGSYCKPCAREKYHVPARLRNQAVAKPTVGEHSCQTCRETKPVEAFDWKSDQARFANRCKACRSARDKANHLANPERRRESALRRKYGIGIAEFDDWLARQGGGCAICRTPINPDARSLAVDHCHASGRVRGILCGRCNKGLGLLRDDPALLREAVRYLEAG